jgi:hypothetical protein
MRRYSQAKLWLGVLSVGNSRRILHLRINVRSQPSCRVAQIVFCARRRTLAACCAERRVRWLCSESGSRSRGERAVGYLCRGYRRQIARLWHDGPRKAGAGPAHRTPRQRARPANQSLLPTFKNRANKASAVAFGLELRDITERV